jgi:hypothetical protein
MRVIIEENNKNDKKKGVNIEYRLNLFLEWLIYMFGYALVLIITSNLFRSLYVENIWYGILAAVTCLIKRLSRFW